MGSRIGSIAARYGLIAALALAVSACATSNVQVSGGAPQPAVSAQGSTPLGKVALLAFIAGIGYESYKDGTRYRANPFDAFSMSPPGPPPLDPTRKVSEQDCTKPLDLSLGNIRCK